MRKIVEIKNLVKSYGGKDYQTKVLKNINLDIYENDFIAIMGPSGAGKSTLLNMLSTLDKPTRGEIIIDGEDITKVNNKRLSKIRQEKIGFIFQDYNLLDNMTLQDNIALPLSLNGKRSREIIEKTKQMASLFGLSEHLNKYPYQMSGGQKQRVASARAIVTNPSLILADEPTGALDSKSSRLLLDSFEKLNKDLEATILMVTHDAFTASYAHRILFIKDGKVFNELVRGNDSRKEFFDRIIEVVTLLGGDVENVF